MVNNQTLIIKSYFEIGCKGSMYFLYNKKSVYFVFFFIFFQKYFVISKIGCTFAPAIEKAIASVRH